jgi:hypothetical protein
MNPPESSIFAAIYDSPWHHPVLCWAATPLVLGALWRARPGAGAARNAKMLWQLALLGQLLIVLDALSTGAWSPIDPTTLASSVAGLLWVVLGDLRYFVLVERFAPPSLPSGGPPRPFVSRAFALSLLIPWLSATISAAVPTLFQQARWKFLVYEVLFLLLLSFIRWVRLPRQLAALPPSPETAALRRWLNLLTSFEMAQYALWVLADVLILAGVPAALLLRLIPNLLYYVAFVPFAYFTAPPALRTARRVR